MLQIIRERRHASDRDSLPLIRSKDNHFREQIFNVSISSGSEQWNRSIDGWREEHQTREFFHRKNERGACDVREEFGTLPQARRVSRGSRIQGTRDLETCGILWEREHQLEERVLQVWTKKLVEASGPRWDPRSHLICPCLSKNPAWPPAADNEVASGCDFSRGPLAPPPFFFKTNAVNSPRSTFLVFGSEATVAALVELLPPPPNHKVVGSATASWPKAANLAPNATIHQ